MQSGFPVGVERYVTHTVQADETVPHVRPGTALDSGEPVLATGVLVFVVEAIAWDMVTPYLETGESRVGSIVNLQHRAPAKTGDAITVWITCMQVTDKLDLYWRFEVTSPGKLIADGAYRMRIIDRERFRKRLQGDI
jgi:fluoroacetyl-CoA thioesterase